MSDYLNYFYPEDNIQWLFLLIPLSLCLGTLFKLLYDLYHKRTINNPNYPELNKQSYPKQWLDNFDKLSNRENSSRNNDTNSSLPNISVYEAATEIMSRAERFASNLPNILLVIGLLGTFLGVGVSLLRAGGVTDISEMKLILDPMGAQFKSSVYGIIFNLGFSFTMGFFNLDQKRLSLVEKLYHANLSHNEAIQLNEKNIANNERKEIIKILNFISQKINFTEEMKNAAQLMSQQAHDMAEASKQIGNSAYAIGESANNLATAVQSFSGQVTDVLSGIKKDFVDQMSTATDNINQSVNKMNESMSNSIDSLQNATDNINNSVTEMSRSMQNSVANLQSTLTNFNETSKMSNDAILLSTRAIRTQTNNQESVLNKLGESISGKMGSVALAATAVSNSNNKFKEVIIKLTDLPENLSSQMKNYMADTIKLVTEDNFNNYQKISNNLSQSNSALLDFTKKIDNSIIESNNKLLENAKDLNSINLQHYQQISSEIIEHIQNFKDFSANLEELLEKNLGNYSNQSNSNLLNMDNKVAKLS